MGPRLSTLLDLVLELELELKLLCSLENFNVSCPIYIRLVISLILKS